MIYGRANAWSQPKLSFQTSSHCFGCSSIPPFCSILAISHKETLETRTVSACLMAAMAESLNLSGSRVCQSRAQVSRTSNRKKQPPARLSCLSGGC